MKLRKLKLENFRLFSELDLEIPNSNVVALIGNNGAGKTTILEAIGLCFTHFTGELISKTEMFNLDSWFEKDDVTLETNIGKVTIDFDYGVPDHNEFFGDSNKVKKISVIKDINQPGHKFENNPNNLTRDIKGLVNNNKLNTIPIIAYYNVNRTGPSSSKNKRDISTFNEKFFAYERALTKDSPNFIDFEEWFIKQKNRENAFKVNEKNLELELPSIKNTRIAFELFFDIIEPDVYSDLNVISETINKGDFSQDVKEFLSITKYSLPFKYSQFSAGERMIIGLVCEIARRLTIANENTENALDGEGVVLIDELELHLHPNWQRLIVSALTNVFPNVQFIFTTHSPLILSGIEREKILVLNNKNIIDNKDLPDVYSGTADEILEKLLFAKNAINTYDLEKTEIDNLFNSLKFDQAEVKFHELKAKINSAPKWLRDYEQRIAFAKS
ncbi:MAG TPA: AAA family ATPase [Saprospiraceae bacterium]|nr:AAA family ATPase [Saprospiraceae bacterium]